MASYSNGLSQSEQVGMTRAELNNMGTFARDFFIEYVNTN